MKNKFIYSLFILVVAGYITDPTPKRHSSIIMKPAYFIRVQMNIRPVSPDEIYADISFANTSSSPILFYKDLLPINGELKEDIFPIHETDTLSTPHNLVFLGKGANKYMRRHSDVILPKKHRKDQYDSSLIIPNLSPLRFLKM